ncbi:ASPIC and UnbV [Stieleria magnilauensis]|uniref:ASPIC and UnbV n=2 Tax=Stieleria magnilauensis TaxID=2527963 RepID=A0ABX5XRV5_9BACT|nr:ASPIC and UnbV [Planctomycetes bacterium TBK1r]
MRKRSKQNVTSNRITAMSISTRPVTRWLPQAVGRRPTSVPPRRRAPSLRGLVLLLVASSLIWGCDRSPPAGDPGGNTPLENTATPGTKTLANPVGTLKLSLRRRQWDQAWEASQIILAQAGVDQTAAIQATDPGLMKIEPDTLALIAQAAHQSGHPDQAAKFLRSACQSESFANPSRVRQTMIAMIGLGQYHDGLDFLEQALLAQPDQHETRRWLFDFYIGADDRVSALRHGQTLVLARRFDIGMLKDLSNTERRTLDADPLDQMVTRNPDDKRPLLGAAKSKFDESKFDEAIKLLREIVTDHPKHHPSQAFLGQALAASRRFEELETWAAEQSDGIQDYPAYWIALGDWARANDDAPAALRAFAQAAVCGDPEVVQIWTRLATLLPEFAARNPDFNKQMVTIVNDRAQQLTRFHQLKDRFTRTGEISRAIALEIAQSLEKLGRLWEAEAWSAIATTLPEDDSVDVAGFRDELVQRLKPGTPWRVPEALPDFDVLFARLPLPSIEKVVSTNDPSEQTIRRDDAVAGEAAEESGVAVDWIIADEAVQRGLTFWGRTSETLDKPGIMLYQTLGCGGGTIDFDLDGWSDLYLVAAGGTPPGQDSDANELFRNLDGQFRPIGEIAQTGDKGFGQGVAVGDVNEDGFPDLLVLNYGPNRLYVNNGDGTFRDASDQMPAGDADEWSSSGAIADLDHDGLADLVVVNYCATLGPVTRGCPMAGSTVMRSCSPMLFPAMPDRFLRSSGDGTFSDTTETWGAITDSPGRGLGIIVGDLDGRLGNEVFVANDMTNNHYWSRVAGESNDTQLALSESAMLRGIGGDDRGIPQGSMGIATGDFDRDGDVDLYVTNFDKEYNTLHTQSSSGIWQDRTGPLGLVEATRPLVAFGTEAIDLDNSGDAEIVVTNGHVDLFSRGDEKAMYDQPMQIFQRSATGRYRSVSVGTLGPYFQNNHVGRGLWTIDANRDGQVDFVVTHQTEPTALMINRTENSGNWIRLDLKGRTSSRDAIGSTLRVETSQGTHTGFLVAGDGYQCSNERMLHFGLGDLDDASVTVSVTWPTGKTEQFTQLPTRTQNVIVESN